MSNYFTLGKPGNFLNFFKGDAVGPGSPNNPIGTILGRFRFFDSGNWIAGLFGFHKVITKYIPKFPFRQMDWFNNQYSMTLMTWPELAIR